MLQKHTVEVKTFRLLQSLHKDKELRNFFLVGGTALALKIGHRKSVDLDMFSPIHFDMEVLRNHLKSAYAFTDMFPDSKSKVILQGFIDDVKVDWVLNKYPFVETPETIDSIRLYSLKDIAAMKLTVISDKGTRLKDFVDVAYLSTFMSFNEMLDAYVTKYNIERERPIRSLTYYNSLSSVDSKIDLIDATYRFEPIDERLHDMKRHPDKVFSNFPIKKNKK